jgi:hypothetical protein
MSENDADVILEGDQNGAYFGYALAGGGNFDGDLTVVPSAETSDACASVSEPVGLIPTIPAFAVQRKARKYLPTPASWNLEYPTTTVHPQRRADRGGDAGRPGSRGGRARRVLAHGREREGSKGRGEGPQSDEATKG